jgi:hypothetical protein
MEDLIFVHFLRDLDDLGFASLDVLGKEGF